MTTRRKILFGVLGFYVLSLVRFVLVFLVLAATALDDGRLVLLATSHGGLPRGG